MEAGGDVNIKGSKVEGEEIEIEAENINIITADNKYKSKETHKEASVTVSAGITNSFVDAYYAGDALVKASEMHARAESELSKIEKLYDSGKASKEAVEDAKLNVTLARVNLASATTNAIASVAGASTSWKTGGVNASLIIDAQINEASKQATTVNAMGSMISANKNVTLTAKNDIKQIGSAVLSKQGDISYEAGDEITIKAGENSYTSKEKNENYNASYAYGTGGYSANAGFSMGGSTTDDMWHTNATVRADEGKISMTTGKNAGGKGDMTIKGANIIGKEIDIKVKGDLVQESLQDRHRTDGKTIGLNAGFSGGTQLSSAVTKYQTGTAGSTGFSGISLGGHYGQTKEDAAWVNQQTSIVGSESVIINAGGKYTNKGALTANADYEIDEAGKIVLGQDKGKLTINAKAFEYIEIEDHDYKNTFKYGGQISVGKFDKEGSFAQNLGTGFKNSTVTGSLYNQGSKKEQINRATIGKGTITIDGVTQTESDLLGLNRDITKAQEITRDEITNALNAEVTVDVRFWSSLAGAIFVKGKGVKDISVVQDIFTIGEAVKEVRGVIKKQSEKRLAKKLEEVDKKTKKKMGNDDKVIAFEVATENLEKVEKYIKDKMVDAETAEKMRRAALDENVIDVYMGSDGEIYAKIMRVREDGQNIKLAIERVSLGNGEYLNIERYGSVQEVYAKQMNAAKESIIDILMSDSKALAKMGKDSAQLAEDAKNMTLELAKGLTEKETYAKAFEGIKGLPEAGKAGFNITQALSNPYIMESMFEGMGGKIYDAKSDPLGAGIGIAKNITNYHLYAAGAKQDNMYYAAGLIFFGAVTEIGSPLKALKALDAGADIAKAGMKAADGVALKAVEKNIVKNTTESSLVYGSEKGLRTLGDSRLFGTLYDNSKPLLATQANAQQARDLGKLASLTVRQTPTSSEVFVIGRLPDTSVAKGWPGHQVLNDPNWTPRVNDEKIIDVIRNQQPVYVGSPLTTNNLIIQKKGKLFETVTQREINIFEGAGYKQVGDVFIPPNKLDIK